MRTNLSSTVKISTDYVEGTGLKFKRIYICLKGCKNGIFSWLSAFHRVGWYFSKRLLSWTVVDCYWPRY
ncbi:hypothetical protein AHAS_Ahas03G0174800 [Arachis hypogaea]